jgi:hypothetical protein
MEHLVERFRQGRITATDVEALHDWLKSDPEVPPGEWYKWFSNFTLAGKAKYPKRF